MDCKEPSRKAVMSTAWLIAYAPVICIPGCPGVGDSGDIAGPKCQFMPYSYNKGEAQPVNLHSLISYCFVA